MLKLIKKRVVPVSFVKYPDHKIDKTLFHKKSYRKIKSRGYRVSPLTIIHSASIHYRGRFPDSLGMRFRNAYCEIIASVTDSGNDKLLYFSAHENSELQARSTEVIGVGLCIALSSKLFKVNKNKFGVIEGSGKRCDFHMIKDGLQYIIESKGRKGSVKPAVQDVFEKKSGYDAASPKYAFISKIPRGDISTSIEVIDPEFTPKEVRREMLISRLLMYYSKMAVLTGHWRLADLLKVRAIAIADGADTKEYENRALDYENVLKFGSSINVKIGIVRASAFYSQQRRNGSIVEFGGYSSIFFMEEKLMRILESQNFEELIDYKVEENIVSESDERIWSILNDGSIMMIAPSKCLEDIVR